MNITFAECHNKYQKLVKSKIALWGFLTRCQSDLAKAAPIDPAQ